MAKGRIVEKTISTSEKINSLSDSTGLLYTWMILHSDDFGLLDRSAFDIKMKVAPAKPWSIQDVESWIQQMISVGLVTEINYKNKKYLHIYRSNEAQKGLRRDRQPDTILAIKLTGESKQNWIDVENIIKEQIILTTTDSQLTTIGSEKLKNDNHLPTTDNKVLSEVKGSEEKIFNSNELNEETSVESEPKKYGNQLVTFVLEEFRRVRGHYPTDKKPRNVAHTLTKQLKTITRDRFGGEVTDERIKNGITKFFDWWILQESAEKVKLLDTARRDLNIFIETLPQKGKNASTNSQTDQGKKKQTPSETGGTKTRELLRGEEQGDATQDPLLRDGVRENATGGKTGTFESLAEILPRESEKTGSGKAESLRPDGMGDVGVGDESENNQIGTQQNNGAASGQLHE